MHFKDSPGFSKRVRDSGEYLVPQIRCNIYVHFKTYRNVAAEQKKKSCQDISTIFTNTNGVRTGVHCFFA